MKGGLHIAFCLIAFFAFQTTFAQAPDITYTTPQSYTIGVPITPLPPTNIGGAVPATAFAQVTTFAGTGTTGRADGPLTTATFNNPKGIAMDAAGNFYIADSGNNLIRKISSSGIVTTLAGSGAAGFADGLGPLATFSDPTGIAVDAAGFIYVTDRQTHIIRKISPLGLVTTFAGKPNIPGVTNAQGTAATFNNPTGIAINASGYLYVADYTNNIVRGIAPDGNVRTVAGSGTAGTIDIDGKGIAATFINPVSVTVGNDGTVYVGDQKYIRKIDANDNVKTISGGFFEGGSDGTGQAARISLSYLTIDAANTLFFSNQGTNTFRRIDEAGTVTTVAGFSRGYVDGVAQNARFNTNAGTVVNTIGEVFVADAGNNVIRKVIITGYTISPMLPAGLTLDSRTGIISGTPTEKLQATNFSVTGYNLIGKSVTSISIEVRVAGLAKQTITFGPLPAKKEGDIDFNANATSNSPLTITYTSSDNQVATITDGKIHILGPGTTTITAFQNGNIDYEEAVPVSQDLTVAAVPIVYTYPTITPKGSPILLPLAPPGTFKTVIGNIATVTTDPTQNPAVIVIGNGTFTCSSVGQQTVSVTAGYGPDPANPLNAEFNAPSNVAYDSQGNIFIADPGNYLIRELSNKGRVTTFAGSGSVGSLDGKNTVARFSRGLLSIVADASGNIYVCDILNLLVRKITAKGDVSSFATAALKAANGGVQVDAESIAIDRSNNIFIADKSRIYQVSPDGNTVSVFAGNAVKANVDGIGITAGFSGIVGLAFDNSGNMYVTTSDNNYVNTVRKITPAGVVTTLVTVTSSSVHFTRLVVDSKGNIFIASSDDKIYEVTNGLFSTFAGSVKGDAEGVGTAALFNNPQGIAIDPADNLYIADSDNHKIKMITPAGIVTTIAGNGHPGIVDNTSVSNAQITKIPVNVTSPLLFTTTYPDVILTASTCAALVPDYTKDAKAISYCTPNITYTQSPAAGTPVAFGVPTTVTLTANDDLSVYDKATVSFKLTINAASSPTIQVAPVNINSCVGAVIPFRATVTNAGIAPGYQWQVNGVNTYSGGAAYDVSTLVTGDIVTCIVTNNDGCAPVSATSIPVKVTVNDAVNPLVSIAPSTTEAICPGSQITLTAIASNIGTGVSPIYQWRVNGTLSGPDNPLFSISTLANGDVVTCTLVGGGNCAVNPAVTSNSFTAQVKTEAECTITIINTFTPNGDGINDFWNLPVLQSYPNCSVLIYNRYGKLVFQSIGYSKPWDGRYSGSILAAGTYYYIIDTKTGKTPLAGSVTILR